MSKSIWIIIFLVILVAIVAVVAAVYYFSFIGSRPIVSEQLQTIRDKDQPIKITATDEQVEHLVGQLEDSDPNARFKAVCLLGALSDGDPERLGPILSKALTNKDPKVRFLAAMRLGTIKYSSAAAGLTTLLDDEDKKVSREAGEALVKLGPAGLRAVMEALAEDTLREVDAGLFVAKRISGRSFGQGPEGRSAALKFWAEGNRSTGQK